MRRSGRGVRAAVNVHDDDAHCIEGGSPEGLGEEVGQGGAEQTSPAASISLPRKRAILIAICAI
eukprot:1147077-Prymnesium_polylepis.1